MKLLNFVPIQLTLFLVAGILLNHFLHIGITVSLTLTSIFLIVLAFLYFSKHTAVSHYFFGAMCLTVISIGMLASSLSKDANFTSHYTHLHLNEMPSWHLKITKVLKPTQFSERFLASIEKVDGQHATGSILLNLQADTLNSTLQVDDELWAVSPLQSIRPARNPHEFDYRSYMASLGITDQLRLEKAAYHLQEGSSRTLYGYAASFRRHIKAKLAAAPFGAEERGIIQALLLGERNDISEVVYNDYKNAGAVHILAVSGLHIDILLLLLQFILSPLKRLPKGKTAHLVLTVVLLWVFAFMAGLSPSVIRAVTMFSFIAYALYLNRPSNTFNIIALSMLFLLLVFDPKLLFQVGFQMSYAAVIIIVWLYPVLQRKWYPKNRIVRKIWQLLSVSIAAQLGVLPISLFYFHQFPGLFFVSNLLIVPFLGIILGLGIVVIVLSLVNALPSELVGIYNFIIGGMNELIAWVAAQEAFLFKNIPFDGVQLILAYGIIFCLIQVLSQITYRKTAMLLGAIMLFQCWLLYSTYNTSKKEALWLAHANRNSLLLHQSGRQLHIWTSDQKASQRIETDYRIGERIDSVRYQDLKNVVRWKNRRIIIIDSLGAYIPQRSKIDYLILTHSPKLNLDRLIDSLAPKVILADGSNYPSFARSWEQTCKKRKLPFHYTGERGAYYFEKNH